MYKTVICRLAATFICGMTLVGQSVNAQTPEPTPATARLESFVHMVDRAEGSLFKNVEFRSIGPAVMSGRIVDLDVSPHDPTHFYVAYASGGLWKTTSNGTDFEPLFEDQAVLTIGDIAVSWSEPEVVYVGTGENNSSRSSYSGTGVYRSPDGGKSWQHLGLGETHHIGRILLDPDDEKAILVAAIGHLYSKNPERGVFKSDDGGESWRQTLFIDDSTGVIDVVRNPQQPSILYAASWHRQRKAWDFREGGETSAVYRSTDEGESWTRISTADSGFPTGQGVGRIGLATAASEPSVLYAVVDNQEIRDKPDEEAPALTFEDLEEMDSEAFLEKVSPKELEEYLEYYDFPERYDVDTVSVMIETGDIAPVDLVEYISDANRELFETPVIGCEAYRSDDGGVTWEKTHRDHLDDTCYSYGYYFGQVRVSPHNPNEVYIAGVPLLKSSDGGESWEDMGRENVHVDHHALWINPTRDGHLINGNDGGLNISYDGGETWLKLNTPSVGQFYTVNYDHEEPYNVYGGLQDNGVWVGPSTYEASHEWRAEGAYPYERLLGGDGMMVEIDPRNAGIVYAGYQFGNYFRLDRSNDEKTDIQPSHDLGDEPLRFNWLAPINLSTHNPDILYLGSNMVHRSMDQGESWTVISDDLTRGAVDGDVPFGTLTALAESPLRFGLLYAGSDDGLIHVSRDGGVSWQRVDTELPQHLWVSRIEPSQYEESHVYVSLNGYRWDHMTPYVYVSRDYGASWERIGADLPPAPVNVVREDPHNRDMLYVGSDLGVFLSIDGGESFSPLRAGMPSVPVHDLRIQPRERELIVGTHGRSIYVADVSHIEKLTPERLARPLFVFALDSVAYSEDWGDRPGNWEDPVEPEVNVAFYSRSGGSGIVVVADRFDRAMAEVEFDADPGINFVTYDLSTTPSSLEGHVHDLAGQTRETVSDEADPDEIDIDLDPRDTGKVYLRPATYEVRVTLNGDVETTSLRVYEE